MSVMEESLWYHEEAGLGWHGDRVEVRPCENLGHDVCLTGFPVAIIGPMIFIFGFYVKSVNRTKKRKVLERSPGQAGPDA